MITFSDVETCYVCKKEIAEGFIRDGADLNNLRVYLCTECDEVAEKMIADGKKAFE